MTDLEAIKQYAAAAGYRAKLEDEEIPEIYQRDPKALDQYRQTIQREINFTEAVMHQAEKALEQLPRPYLREALRNRYFLALDEYETADAMAYSVRSVFRFEQQAFEYLETGKAPEWP